MSLLTQKQLDAAFGKLMAHATPETLCPQCKRPMFTFGNVDAATPPCLDCRGAHVADFVMDGRVMRGLVDRDGVPLFFSGIEEMQRIEAEGRRRKAASAGLPASAYIPQPDFPPSDESDRVIVHPETHIVEVNQDAPRYNYDEATGTFHRA